MAFNLVTNVRLDRAPTPTANLTGASCRLKDYRLTNVSCLSSFKIPGPGVQCIKVMTMSKSQKKTYVPIPITIPDYERILFVNSLGRARYGLQFGQEFDIVRTD